MRGTTTVPRPRREHRPHPPISTEHRSRRATETRNMVALNRRGTATPGPGHADDESPSVSVGPTIPDSEEEWLAGAGGLLMLALDPRCPCGMFSSFGCRLPR